jgi:large repetitive protein
MMIAVLYVAGCGGSSKSGGGGGNQNPALTISAVTLPTGYVGSNYASTTLKATGGSGSGYAWSVSSGTSLPGGITLSAGGVLAGKPTADAVTNFGVTVTDSANATASSQLSITIKKGVSITTAALLPDGFVGASYSKTLAASGGTDTGYAWSLASGSALPDGLTLTSAGVLSGKPTAAGAASFSITVSDSAQNTATVQFSASIKTGIAVASSPALPTAFVGSYYAEQLEATGGSGTYTWSLAGPAAVRSHARRMTATGLPDGLSLSSDGWITGTPTSAGTSTATVIVTDSASNSATMDLTFTISSGLFITTASTLPGGHPGDIYSQTFSARGGSGTGYIWTSDSLPGGMRLSTDGVLSGSLPAVNTYSLTVTVTDSLDNTASATFNIKVTNELRFATASALQKTYTGLDYRIAFQAKGGSGNGYRFNLSAGSTLPPGFVLTSGGSLSGKASASGTFDFNVTVTDSAANTAQAGFELTVGSAIAITSPATLSSPTVGDAYTQSITVTGGSGSGYIWTVTSGGPSLSAVGLSFTNGVVSGTPTATGTASFSVSVTDDSMTHDSRTFTVTVHSAGQGYAVSGQIMLGNACGVSSIPAITLTLDNNPAKTVTSDGTGNYSFASVSDGDHTITPSISGANSIFYPTSMPVTVSGGAVTNQNFLASLAFKVSGTVSYSGAETGQIYIWLLNKNCGGSPLGTSISAPGTFTIEGVPPGSYTLGAGIDSLGFGYQNDVDAAGLASPDVTVGDANVTGTSITMTDPFQSAPPAGVPTINAITGNASGVVINYQPITGPHPIFKHIGLPTAYVVQWSEDPAFALVNGSLEFKAGGSNGTGVLILNDSHLASGNTYYFRMLGTNKFGTGTWSNIYSADGINPTGVTIGDPAGNAVSGTVTFDATPTGPLYVGYYDVSKGAVYATRIASPVSPQPYSVNVPTGQTYFHFAILDQNNDGMIDPGDVSNIRTENVQPVPVAGAMSNQDIDLNTPSSKATVTTQHVKSYNEDGSVVETYSLNFDVREGNLLPVSVRLMSGPHIIHPVDLGKCLDCGNNQFQYNVGTYRDIPAAGDSYTLLVAYSDGSSETLTAVATGVLDASQFPTNLSPNVTVPNLQPTFTWTYPANPSNYTYQFGLTSNGNGDIWDIPARGSNRNGFTYSDIPGGSISWGVDPTNQANTPIALSGQTTYRWWIATYDSNNNSAQVQTYFVASVNSSLSITTASLPAGNIGASYSQTLAAVGGTGTGYTWSATGSNLATYGLTLSSAGVVSGTPTTAGTASFTPIVTDSANATATASAPLTIQIIYAALDLPGTNPFPDGTVGVAYTGTLTAIGGSGNFTWGIQASNPDGLNFIANGAVLTISGTPTSAAGIGLTITVLDNNTNLSVTKAYTITVNAAGSQVRGQIMLGNACGVSSIPAITLSIDTNPVQTTTTDGNGNYAFAGVPNGTYTITPSVAEAKSVFYPASNPITVNNAAVDGLNFTAALGYTVSGAVSYAGSQTGQTYIWLLNKNCGGSPLGTSITAPGSFTIEGVPPGTYTLGAGIDSFGFGYQNDVDAAGLASPDVTIADADVTGTSIAMTDPTEAALPTVGPIINAIVGNDSGAVINFQPIVGPHPIFNQIELPTLYGVQWSDDPTFAHYNGVLTFAAGGSNGTGVLILNDSRLVSGGTYYFRMKAGNKVSVTDWTIYSTDGVNPTAVTIGAAAGNLVSGTITFDATPTGPLYVGYYDIMTGAVYATRIASPVSPQPYSVTVPTGSTYFPFAILDQNNDGMIDPGDISNTHNDNVAPIGISGATSGQDLTLNTPSSTATVTTQHVKSNNEDGSTVETYNLYFEVREGNLLPVSVRLMSGPHIINPIDLGRCLDCNNVQFQYNVGTYSDVPAVGDSYDLLVKYSDGTSEHLTALVTGVMNEFATNLDPSGTSSTSLTPTFAWTDPANPGNYQYSFYMNDNQGNTIWQIPGNNSHSSGFSSSITSITWGTDPTGGSSTPTGSLTHGGTYYWQIQVIDGNGNSTQQRTFYKP